MSLQKALLKAGLVEAQKVEIQPGWKKCEIHGISKLPLDSTLIIPLRFGQAGTSCTPWEDGMLTIHPQGIQHNPKHFNPILQKALNDIKTAYPQCEILWY
ncbi:hypothetical protein ACFL3T_03505 [Patescibacteria group bacterium]